ncbi:MAG: KH domain-containing protein [Deltaproteobacteria bacterium]|nr:KH domain-containing protein [Deltaproteobacteria bacterium]MCL5277323.1 KH domain-containing protein [Deltaproteobacteria bacterium]
MKELVEGIAKQLVDRPDSVQVKVIESEHTSVIELTVDKEDMGKIIGREGKTVKAIRTILGAVGNKLKKRFVLEIVN